MSEAGLVFGKRLVELKPGAKAQKRSAAAGPVYKPSPTGVIEADVPVEGFVKWMRKEGFTLNKCKIGEFSDTGRGVVATGPIKKGEVVISVPEGSIITTSTCTCRAEIMGAGLDEESDPGPRLEVEALILAVMHEIILGKKSRWYHYLEALPEELDTPVTWSANETDCLVGTATWDRFSRDLNGKTDPPCMVYEGWARIGSKFVEEHPDLGLPTGEDGLALYEYATSLVAAYSFTLGDDHQAMVPFWDFLNHKTGLANIRLNHSPKHSALQMIATRDIAAGEEVVNSYGDLSNAELLRRHGFVEEGNIHDVGMVHAFAVRRACWQKAGGVKVVAGRPLWRCGLEGMRVWRKKLALLAKAGIMGTDHRFPIGRSGAPPPELSTAIQLLLMSARDFKAATRALRRGHLPDLPPPSERPTRESSRVHSILREVAEMQLSQYPASVGGERDLWDMDPPPAAKRLAAAEVVRQGEMDCLQALRVWAPQNNKEATLHPYLVWSDRISVGRRLGRGRKKSKSGGGEGCGAGADNCEVGCCL